MKPLRITCPIGSQDAALFQVIVNAGIDSHLEAFTKSKFEWENGRLILNFDRSELPTLVRRLRELGRENSDLWADDIEGAIK